MPTENESPYDGPADDALDDEEFEAAWAEADSAALEVLRAALPGMLSAPAPQPDLPTAVARLRTGLRTAGWPYDYFLAACAWRDEGALPEDDEDLWLDALAATISPEEDPGWPAELQSSVLALEHGDWLGAVLGAVRAGAGSSAEPEILVGHVASCPEVEGELDPDSRPVLEGAFEVVLPLWQALGAVDADRRLTRLGAWGLPLALDDVWERSADAQEEVAADLRRAVAGAQTFEQVYWRWRDSPETFGPGDYEAVAELASAPGHAEMTATVVREGPEWAFFLERVHGHAASDEAAAQVAYLLAIRAEWAGDVAEQARWLEIALARRPDFASALELAAELAGDRGDAATARDLLRRAGVGGDDSELSTYETFARPPTAGAAPRNAPCPCGSGRKYKLCCASRVGHPLAERSRWLWGKLVRFTQRPPQRETLLLWARRAVGVPDEAAPDEHVVDAAMRDPLVSDAALFDGRLLERFLDRRGPLLPADERALAESWRDSRRAAYEVVSVRRGFGLTVRDLLTDETYDVRERSGSEQLERRDVLLARLLSTGDGWMVAFAMRVPRLHRARLVEVLRTDGDVLGWLRQAESPPTLQTTDGEELVLVTQRWRLSDAARAWQRLGSELEAEGDDVLVDLAASQGAGQSRTVRGRLERAGDVVELTTNSVPRAERLAARVREADPGAELLEDHRQTPEEAMRGPHAAPDPVEMTPDMEAALTELMREHERRWVDEQIPMFGGRTPRQMVRSAAGRREVEAFLDDLEHEMPQGTGIAGMDPGRIRELLGLPPSIAR